MQASQILGNPLFSGISDLALESALERIRSRIVKFDDKRVVKLQGEPYDSLCLLTEGRLVATIEMESGRSLMVETLAAPDVLAVAVFFAPEPVIPVTLTAVSAGSYIEIERDDLDRLGMEFPAIFRRLLVICAEKFEFITTKMRLLHFATIRQKVASYLLERYRFAKSDGITLPYTRERLAELFGVARPSLSRVLGEMANEGLIAASGRRVTVLQAEALKEAGRE